MRNKFFSTLVLLFCFVVGIFAQQAVAVWHFDEASGLQTLEGVSNQSFTIKNDYPKQVSERVAGVSNEALRFNGYATWVEGDLATALPSLQTTVSAWVALEVHPVSSAAVFTNVAGSTGAYLGIDKFGRLEIGATANGVFNQKITTQKIPLWQWTHIALTVNTSEGKMRGYINGSLVAEQNVQMGSLSWATPDAVKIGKHHTPTFLGTYETGVFCGLIDEVKIFDTALTQAQLADIAAAEMPTAAPDMRIPASRFEGDPHRPIFHAIPAANWMNEPHGLVFHDGLYHVFYQKNGNGPYWGRLNWGHQSSPDLVTWTEHPVVLFPDPASPDQEGCWSGCSIPKDGKPFIMYTGVDGGTAQMCLAEANADLSAYQKYTGNPVVATPPAPYTTNDFRDPYIWAENGGFYMIIGSGLNGSGQSGGAALLYRSTNLTNWTYLQVLHKGYPATDNSGGFWEVPMFLTFGNKRVLPAQPVPQAGVPARILYWTGTFENEAFVADSIKPTVLEPGDNLLGVTTTIDAQGRTIAIGIIPDILPQQEQRQNGWANLMSLPRVWSLSQNGGSLLQKPLPELVKLRGANHHFDNLSVVAGTSGLLPAVNGRHLEIRASIDPGTANRVGLVVAKSADNSERTRIFWDAPFGIVQIERSNSSTNGNAPKGSVSTLLAQPSGMPLDFHIFLDGSVLEVFINDEKALSTRIYPENPGSIGLDLFAQGGTAHVQYLDVWEMKSMYDSTVTSLTAPIFAKKNGVERLFPNPTTGHFFVKINLLKTANIEVWTMDAQGKRMGLQAFGKLLVGQQLLEMQQKNLAPGHYFLQVLADGQPLGMGRFLKN